MKKTYILAALLTLLSFPALATVDRIDPNAMKVTPEGGTTPLPLSELLEDAVNVKSFGAKGDGATDDTAAINAALAYAKTVGKAVYAPSGTYDHNDVITVDSVVLFGDGPTTIFNATDVTSTITASIGLTGSKAGLKDVYITTEWAGVRQTNDEATAARAYSATDFFIKNVFIEKSASAGILVKSSSKGVISGNTIQNTLADGIHNTGESSDISIYDNKTYNTGDDSIAVVSYNTNTGVSRNFLIYGNTIDTSAARGIAVVGGSDVTITNNDVSNITASCVYVASESSYDTNYVKDIIVSGNRLYECSSVADNPASIRVLGRSGYTVENVKISNNILKESNASGISMNDSAISYVKNISITDNYITSAPSPTRGSGIVLNAENSIVSGNKIEGYREYAIYTSVFTLGGIEVSENVMRGNNTSANASIDAALIKAGPKRVVVSNNIQENGSTTVERCFEITGTPALYFYGNSCEDNNNLLPSTSVSSNVFLNGGHGYSLNGGNAIRFPTSDTTRGKSIAIGPSALLNLSETSAAYTNIAIGYNALLGNSATPITGINNVVVGESSAAKATGAITANTSLGTQSLGAATAGDFTGSENTAMGVSTLRLLSTATGNSAFGRSAGAKITSGSQNTLVGYKVGSTTLTTGSNNILIGTSTLTDTPAADTSNYLNIENTIKGDTSLKNVSIGGGALATTATSGFLYVPTTAGTPTGAPTEMTGFAPIVVDTTNNKLYFYSGGSWRDAGP